MHRPMKKLLISTVALACVATDNFSQDLKAGEINVKSISGYTYEATVYLYENISTLVPRPTITIDWGSGGQDTLSAIPTGCGDTNTTGNKYIGTHTYPGPGTYVIFCTDSFRMANIYNISNSLNEKLYLQYQLTINPFIGLNSSPLSLTCPHDTWQCCSWIYNSSTIDSDGDSLSYKLVQPFTTNYSFPPASVDSITGDMTFNPTATGLYAFCMRIDEWRKISSTYYLIGSTFRQMQIDVYSLTAINENNYPQTVLQFTDRQTATLNLYNSNGQLVRTIDNITGGQVTIDRNELANGLYFFVLRTDNKIIATGKLATE